MWTWLSFMPLVVAQIWGGQMMATHYLLACFPAWRAPLQAACTAAGLGTFAIMLIPRLMGPAYRTFRAVLFASFAACAAVPVVIYGARVVPGWGASASTPAICWAACSARVRARARGSGGSFTLPRPTVAVGSGRFGRERESVIVLACKS